MFKRKIGVFILAMGLTAAMFGDRAQADPTNVRPVVLTNSTLQATLDSRTVGGPGISAADDQQETALFTNDSSGAAIATFVIDLADFSGSNRFGMYSADDSTNRALIFDGGMVDPMFPQAFVSFMSNGNVMVNGSLVATDFGANFGFYLDVFDADSDPSTLDHTVYSEDSLNGGAAQALVYRGDDATTLELPPFSAGTFSSNEFILAFESTLGGTNNDYSDLVVLVESISPVPAPGAALLGVMGFGLVGWVKRRFV